MNILISDDDKDYGLSLVDSIESNCEDVKAFYFQNWEDAKSDIDSMERFYDLVIIDGKGQLDADSSANDSAHALRAHTDLSEMKDKNKILDYVINTGYHESFKDFEALKIKVYRKPEDQKKLLSDIQEFERTHDLFVLKAPHEKSFNVAEFIIGSQGQIRLFEIMKDLNAEDPDYQKIREFIEDILSKLEQQDKIPFIIKTDGKRNVTNGIRYLSGQEVNKPGDRQYFAKNQNRRVINQVEENALNYIWKTTSAIQHNKSLHSTRIYYSLTYALLEILDSMSKNFD